MAESLLIPIFSLSLLPLPGELIPLHIFEPRYKQLLYDCETTDVCLGIFLTHACNVKKLGALMKLESVIKRYSGGASDVVLRCVDMFSMRRLFDSYKTKRYPGGQINNWQIDLHTMPGVELYELFRDFQQKRKISRHFAAFTLYQLASELNLDVRDRYRFMTMPASKRESFLKAQLRFQMQLMEQEENSRGVFRLN